MLRVSTVRDLRAALRVPPVQGARVGLVPTMGALHPGHISLVEAARAAGADFVVATVFVNPKQFGPNEDLTRYPRDLPGDFEKLAEAGVDAVFTPTPDTMYPGGFQTQVSVIEASQGLCGSSRAGHFDGVATVVLKLLNIVRPALAVFGEKDFQQLTLIRTLVRDLNVEVEVIGAPLVREPDGIAMSSRNLLLSGPERVQARAIFRGLDAARHGFDRGERDGDALVEAARAILLASGLAPEYLELRAFEDLAPLERADRPCVLLVAATVGRTRLIDNVILSRPGLDGRASSSRGPGLQS